MAGSITTYAVTHAALEAPYIFLYGQQYLQMMRNLARDPSPPKDQALYVGVAYVLFGVATYVLVYRDTLLGTCSLKTCLFKAALYGLAVYGVFNLTNMVAFNGYDKWVATRDLIYGVLSMCVIALVAFYMRKKPIVST